MANREYVCRKVRLMNMCYKIEVQNKNAEKLNRKLDELNLPIYMRKYFTVKIESKAGALNYLGVIVDLLNWFIEEKIINKERISDIEPSDFTDIMAEDITLYLKTKEQNGMSPTTLETRKHIISSFWDYMSRVKGTEIKDGFFKDVTYKGIPSGNNLTKKLPTEKQLNDMEEKIMWKKDIPVRNRNIAIFRVLRGTGIRESELAGLDLSDLHLDEEMPYITILGKGVYREMQNRTVYLTGSALKALREWLEYRSTLDNIVDTEAVFINKNGTRATERNIKQIFENYGNGITPHMMRHYYASVMNQNGNLAFVQQQLGHSSVNTTVNNYANGAVGMKTVLENM
ncbi:tyrosine-type recombinase/integrase [Roseburia inulinivorans]|uniref:tyrosine-type recombinase/integrase n=1 Tax=Roseburia inulinivorans TaxID=360807 RepID=UPI0032BF7D69